MSLGRKVRPGITFRGQNAQIIQHYHHRPTIERDGEVQRNQLVWTEASDNQKMHLQLLKCSKGIGRGNNLVMITQKALYHSSTLPNLPVMSGRSC